MNCQPTKKALCIASMASNLDNFNRNNVKILRELGYDVTLASNFYTTEDSNSREKIDAFVKEMKAEGIRVAQIDFSRKLRDIRAQIKSYKQVKKLVEEEFHLIHCHSPICSVITRFAAKNERKKGTRVIYTAHGFHFYDGAPIKNWLLFYPVEWVCSWWTDVLITINKEDYERAKKHFHAKKTVYVPGVGIDTKKFAPIPNNREKIRKMLGVKDDQIMLLSVGELNENKNHEAVIRAIADYPDILYVIVGKGELEEHLSSVIREFAANVILTGFREDVSDFYDAADVFILPSIREGLNVSLMEAMASGLAVACSNIRGNTDLITDSNCLFSPRDTDSIKLAIDYTIKHKAELGEQNLERIRTLFDLSSVVDAISVVYIHLNTGTLNMVNV